MKYIFFETSIILFFIIGYSGSSAFAAVKTSSHKIENKIKEEHGFDLMIYPKPKTQISIDCSLNGIGPASTRIAGACLQLYRQKPDVVKGGRGRIKFTPALKNISSNTSLYLKIRSNKNYNKLCKLLISCKYSSCPSKTRKEVKFKSDNTWQTVAMPLPQRPNHKLAIIDLWFKSGNGYDFDEISLRSQKDIFIELTNNPHKALQRIKIAGYTKHKNDDILICLKRKDGKTYTKKASNDNGQIRLIWENAPLKVGSNNKLYAIVNKKKKSPSLNIFGYETDNDYLWLKVKGKGIYTSSESKKGETLFIPVGIGYCRDVIIGEDDDKVIEFCKSQHLNTIRLPFYTRFFNNNPGKPINIEEHIKYFIQPVVDAAKRNKMYVILDDHGYFSNSIDERDARGKRKNKTIDEKGVKKWISSWTKVAETYKDEPYILGYELQNEPNNIKPENMRKLYSRCIKAIRKIDKRHIIILGNHNWTHARALEKSWGTTANKIDKPYNNVVFAFHDYPLDNNPWEVRKYVTAFRDKYNVPVMCTEFGATHWNKSETVCREFQAGLLALCAQEKIGWMIWALKRLENNPRSPYNNVDKTGLGPPRQYDSCSYSDIWPQVARIMGSSMPKPKVKRNVSLSARN